MRSLRRFKLQPKEKLRGGYYTPPEIATWLTRWAIRSSKDTVLEPSSGDGEFLAAVAARLLEVGAKPRDAIQQVFGIEIEPKEARKASQRLTDILGTSPEGSVACADFFSWLRASGGRKYDCAVGNPPFIRYQNFPEPSRSHAMSLLREIGLRPNKLTNTWVPFVIGAAVSLNDDGRLAFVLPAELLQVSYAAQLRRFLAAHFRRLHIFACNHLVFEDAEQETLLLLADGYSPSAQHESLIEMIETHNLADLLAAFPNHKDRTKYSTVDHSTEKWLTYFLSKSEIGLMRALQTHPEIVHLWQHAQIDVGVVTGRNEFFVVSNATIQSFNLGNNIMPVIGRSCQLRGAILSGLEWKSLADAGQKVHLLTFAAPKQPPLNRSARRYIQWGEKMEFHRGYKCSIRAPWYRVPSVWAPDCFFLRQIYDFPRVILNEAEAVSTDTVHRMRCRGSPASVLENIYTHLTAASAEIEGRSYGGGVLELEPNEAERLLMPKVLVQGLPIAEIDRLVRAGKITSVLEQNDRLILQTLGLTVRECCMLRQIWQKMKERRLSRKRRPARSDAPVCGSPAIPPVSTTPRFVDSQGADARATIRASVAPADARCGAQCENYCGLPVFRSSWSARQGSQSNFV
jgi:adenine-specific DNA methylase